MIKLYDEDAYLTEFTAHVTACEKAADGWRILLDRTAFFPTAGGQDCDTGILDGKAVLSVELENEQVFHILSEPIPVGSEVSCRIDAAPRFRKMQHHSAEHIVSGLVTSRFGCQNTGFHLSDKEVTIDYSAELTQAELIQIEKAANEIVQKNIEILTYYPEAEALPSLSYRSKLDLTENVRLVEIPNVDICACCAPHVKRTGEIGIIKLRDMMRHRSGVRIRMICGMDAYHDYVKKAESTLKISNLLSAKQDEVAEAVGHLMSELADKKQQLSALSESVALKIAEQIPETSGSLCIFENGLDTDALRTLANAAKEKCGGILAVLSGSDEAGYSYIIVSKNNSLRAVSQDINQALSGRGGGRDDMLMGSFKATKTEIEEYFKR